MKTIALAVAALVSGAAFAQSNVTLYGRVDLSYNYSKSDFKKFSGIENGKGLNGGSTRIGVSGEEALGNGLKAVFKLEWGSLADEGGGPTTARYTYVGLAGKFGTVTIGRDSNPADRFVGATGVQGINANEPIALFRGKISNTVNATGWNNSIAYLSPNFSGFDFAATYSFGEKVISNKDARGRCDRVRGQNEIVTSVYGTKAGPTAGTLVPDLDNVTGYTVTPARDATYSECADTTDAAQFGLGVRYANGPLYLTAVYQAVADDDHLKAFGSDDKTVGSGAKGWSLGGTYDFKVVKLYANYFREKTNHYTGEGSGKQTAWSLGLGIPVSSAGTVALEYARYKDYRTPDDDFGHQAKGYSVGYRHNLSKRTHLYTYISRINNNRGVETGWDKTRVAGEKQTNFTTGIVHLF